MGALSVPMAQFLFASMLPLQDSNSTRAVSSMIPTAALKSTTLFWPLDMVVRVVAITGLSRTLGEPAGETTATSRCPVTAATNAVSPTRLAIPIKPFFFLLVVRINFHQLYQSSSTFDNLQPK